MTDKELLQHALEALEALHDEQNGPPLIRRQPHWETAMAVTIQAITALRERLALSYVPKVWMQCPECGKKSPMPDPDHKEWQGLTEEERETLYQEGQYEDYIRKNDVQTIARAIEARLKERNT